MKNLIFVAFGLGLLIAATAPVTNAASFGVPAGIYHSGPYDNAGHGPNETGLKGGGG